MKIDVYHWTSGGRKFMDVDQFGNISDSDQATFAVLSALSPNSWGIEPYMHCGTIDTALIEERDRDNIFDPWFQSADGRWGLSNGKIVWPSQQSDLRPTSIGDIMVIHTNDGVSEAHLMTRRSSLILNPEVIIELGKVAVFA